jgi:hypothetical protein
MQIWGVLAIKAAPSLPVSTINSPYSCAESCDNARACQKQESRKRAINDPSEPK